MFKLKSYQLNTIEAIGSFMASCKAGESTPAEVFSTVAASMGLPHAKYHDPFGGAPCVCVKVPTGGGKTVIAAASIAVIDDAYTQTGHPFVLWLTPSDTITQQTVKALKDTNHPYRQAIEKSFTGVQVLSMDDVETLPQCDFTKPIVLVANIQTFNIEKTAQRNAYAFNEAFEPFFSRLSTADCEKLERVTEDDLDEVKVSEKPEENLLTAGDLGRVKYSLANLIALHNPIVIVDEAHNARTDRFFKSLCRLNPAAVLELTATPVPAFNNVIHQVSAWELKEAEMVKLPIVLRGYNTDWTACLEEAIALRKTLESSSVKESEYIRPIILIQAHANTKDAGPDTPTPEVVKEHLEKRGIPSEQIAIATGTTKDLADVDLMKPDCAVRFVITIKALKEGWDCPFAYVLCSLQNIRSSKDVEQLLGRIMRMPYAELRESEELNRAYASVISPNTYEAASILSSRLVQSMGFDQSAASSLIEQELPQTPNLFSDLPLSSTTHSQVVLEVTSETDLKALAESSGLSEHVSFSELLPSTQSASSKTKKFVATFDVRASTEKLKAFEEKVVAKQPKAVRVRLAEAFGNVRNDAFRNYSKACQQATPVFLVPRLCFNDGGRVRPVGGEVGTWNPLDYGVSGLHFKPASNQVSTTRIDVEKETHRMQTAMVEESAILPSGPAGQSVPLLNVEATREDLIRTMARRLRRDSILFPDLCAFVDKAVDYAQSLGHGPQVLLRNRVRLEQALRELLDKNFEEACEEGYELQLDLACPDPENRYAFRFDKDKYPARSVYDASGSGRIFKKHYYPVIDDLRCRTAAGKVSEEYRCAEAIELNPHVTTWVRNIPKCDSAFSLCLSGGRRFFPDFVAQLDDGRVLVVEYKGEDRASNDDSKEKKRVGEIWQESSGGRGVFVFAVEKDAAGRGVFDQIRDAIEKK